MTTLRDILRDFANDCYNIQSEVEEKQRQFLDDDLPPTEEIVENLIEDKLEGCLYLINKRLIG